MDDHVLTEESAEKILQTSEVTLAKIKLPEQWKITIEFNLMDLREGTPEDISRHIISMMTAHCKDGIIRDQYGPMSLNYMSRSQSVEVLLFPKKPLMPCEYLRGDQLPKTQEWSRIELTHEEEEDGKYLSLSVNGLEPKRMKVDHYELGNIDDLKIVTGGEFCEKEEGYGWWEPDVNRWCVRNFFVFGKL